MFGALKKKHVLAKFYYQDEIELVRLDNGRSVRRTARPGFSSDRLLVADFHRAEKLLSQMLKELVGQSAFDRIILIVQQKHDFPDGMSEVEKRAYRDLAEHAGAIEVYILRDAKELSAAEIFSAIKVFKDQL